MLVDKTPPPEGTMIWEDSVPAIKHWKPIHDQVLALHLAGYQNTVIAERLDLHVVRVSQILNDPRAERAIEKYRDKMARKFTENIETRLVALGSKAVDRIAETVNEQFKPGTHAKKHQDDVSFKTLKMLGYGKGSDNGTTEAGVKISVEVGDRLVSALEKSAKASAAHGPVLDAEIVNDDDD